MVDQLKVQGINSRGFGIIPKLVMQDRELHATAKAIYAYFCSYAGAGDVCFPTRSKICYDLNISNDTFSKHLKNLVRCEYVKVDQIKENGRFSHNVYTLCSTKLPCPKNSDTENFGHGKSDTINNSIKNNSIYKNNNEKEKEINKEKESEKSNDHFLQNDRVTSKVIKEKKSENSFKAKGNKKTPRVTEEQIKKEFQEVWNLYPRKQGKKAAYASFTRARKNNTSFETIKKGIVSYCEYIANKKISQEFIKQGSTFFNQNAWEDEWNTEETRNSYQAISVLDYEEMTPEEQKERDREELRQFLLDD